jgi:hypothetical protein
MIWLFKPDHFIPKQAGALEKIVNRYGSDAFVKDTASGKYYLNVDAAVDFMMNDDNKIRIPPQSGDKMAYFPSKRFFIDVPKQKILDKEMVPEDEEDEILDRIKWKIGRQRMTKNHMMVMCLLAHFDWERPIYFSVTVGGNASLGLKEHLQLEGLAYRLVPVKGNNSAQAVDGGIHTDKMYDNLMNKFQWGNVGSDEYIYMDDDNRRMTTNMRLQFSNLAAQLNSEGKKDSAKKLLEKSLEVMPQRNVPYNRIMVMTVREFYKAGAKEDAEELARELFDRYDQAMAYYVSLSAPFSGMNQVSRKMREAQYVMQSLTRLASQYGGEELQKEFRERLQEYTGGRGRRGRAAPGGAQGAPQGRQRKAR